MATQQEVADYINANINSLLTDAEIAQIDAVLTPATAEILIKLLGDVSILTFIRDNGPN